MRRLPQILGALYAVDTAAKTVEGFGALRRWDHRPQRLVSRQTGQVEISSHGLHGEAGILIHGALPPRPAHHTVGVKGTVARRRRCQIAEPRSSPGEGAGRRIGQDAPAWHRGR